MVTKKDFGKVFYAVMAEDTVENERIVYPEVYYELEDVACKINEPIMVGIYELKEILVATKKETIETHKA